VTDAYLGLGSNLGDRLATLRRAVDLLGETPGVEVAACSRIWETDPVGGPPQPDFLNVVLRIRTSLEPKDLLSACHEVEAALARVRDVRWGPRTVDVDILSIEGYVSDDPELIVPHPRVTDRAFVLLPLLDLDPDPVLSDGTHVLDVPLGPDATGGARVVAPPFRT
jgi:2-amino-4-hydroxy-6-hydroxymethyldihydropteridine diphosphokinase